MKKIALLLVIGMMMLTGCAENNSASSSAEETVTSATVTETQATTTAVTTSKQLATTTEPAASVTEATTTKTEQTTTTTAPESTVATTTTVTTTTTAVTTTKPATTTTKQTTTAKAPDVKPAEKRLVALTFDDGPNTTTTMEVLDVLEQYNVKATFFLIGNNIDANSEKSVKRAYDMGCEIGNHSQSHGYMDKMTAEEIQKEVKQVSDKVKEITGEKPKFFRPPYIAVSKDMYDNIDMTFICGYGCNDWDSNVSVEKRIKYVEKYSKDGNIILLHDAKGNSGTVEALKTIIPDLLADNVEFVTLSELFEAKGVAVDGSDNNMYSEVL